MSSCIPICYLLWFSIILFLRGMLCSNGCIQPSCASYRTVPISNHNCQAFVIQLQKLSCGWTVGKKVSEESKNVSILNRKAFYLWFSQFCLDVKNFMLLFKSERIFFYISHTTSPQVTSLVCFSGPICIMSSVKCQDGCKIWAASEIAFQSSSVNNLCLCK